MDDCCNNSTESKNPQNVVIFITTNSVYKMLHEHSIFCLLWLHFLRITTSDDRIVKFKWRTSVRGWTHCSDTNPSCSDFCNAMDVKVMYYFQLIFTLHQGSYKHSECSLYQSRGTPLAGWILILSKMLRGITRTQLKWTAVLQTKILPKT